MRIFSYEIMNYVPKNMTTIIKLKMIIISNPNSP